jgi:pyrimidine-nucleoside phosphorylase
MRAVDIIRKKRDREVLTENEIRFLIQGLVDSSIPTYQISAWLMAVIFSGMTREETAVLTQAMIESGDRIDLSGCTGPFVDKHSTGGVGDKVSLILAPIVAAAGAKVPMMSGRALGHTGGTLDKLDAIPGYTTALSNSRFAEVVESCGFAMTGQSEDIVPADRILYALRDVTATVESVPLITASILSKKFAEGADSLIFDVKCGRGAFMKTRKDAEVLAQSLVETGTALGKGVVGVITRMEQPLGYMIGNFLEVEESCRWLGGYGPDGLLEMDPRSDALMEVTHRLAGWMLTAAGITADPDQGEVRSREVLASGAAWETFLENLRLQGGDPDLLVSQLGKRRAPVSHTVRAGACGVIESVDSYSLGLGAVRLGAGRATAEDPVLPDVGIEVFASVGDTVAEKDVRCTVYAETEASLQEALDCIQGAWQIGPTPPDTDAYTMILQETAAL